MSRSTFSGPIKAGDIKYNTYKDVGTVTLQQAITFDVSAGDTATTTKYVYLPINSKIIEVYADIVVAYTAAGTVNLTIGKVASGVDYVSSIPLVTTGTPVTVSRIEISPTTQLVAWQATSSDISSTVTGTFPVSQLAITVANSGAAATTGKLNVIIQYTQADDRSTFPTQ